MTRRLLPYEYQLIEALGVSKEEYLDFLQKQFDYTKSLDEKLEEPQAWETVAIVLTIVGVLFQVGAALLAPKPDVPTQQSRRLRRDYVFAPRFGFNSTQELAKYGDPVNLIYCNNDVNPNGGVRVNTSLLWSAVDSFGTSQFMQTVSAISAGSIPVTAFDTDRVAFGQTPVRQFGESRRWIYMRNGGVIQFSDLRTGDSSDPSRLSLPASAAAYQAKLNKSSFAEGFSQAFSPSSLTRCGISGAIPINVVVLDRDDKGSSSLRTDLGIEIVEIENNAAFSTKGYWPKDRLDNTRNTIPVGTKFTLRFKPLVSGKASDIKQTASELRRSLASYIDGASIYKLGSAQFRVVRFIDDLDSDDTPWHVVFRCIVPGICPSEDYSTVNFKQNEQEATDEIIRINASIADLRLKQIKLIPSQNALAQGIAERLEEIRVLEDLIDDLTDRKITARDIKAINANAEAFDPEVIELAREVDAARLKRRELQDKIEDELDKDSNKEKIKEWREKKSDWSKAIKSLTTQLSQAFTQYGFRDSAIPDGKGGNLREEKRALRQLRKKYHQEIAELVQTASRIDDTATNQAFNVIQADIDALVQERAVYQEQLQNPELLNDYFGTKCLVKIEEASYETITECRVVTFALKARVFKKIQGRAKVYGEVEMDNYKNSDNGTKMRSMFFWMWIKQRNGQWQRVPRVFAIRRGTENDNYMSLRFVAKDNTGKWQFRFEPIAETAAEMLDKGVADFAYIENSGPAQGIGVPGYGVVRFTGRLRNRNGLLPPINNNPSEVDEWTLFSMRSDTQLSFSFENGPELEIKAVTEQRVEPYSTYENIYDNLVLLGFNIYSGQGVQDLRSMSIFANTGKLVRTLNPDGTYSAEPDAPTCYAPEIFLDTILDDADGIGRYAKVQGIDTAALAIAKQFCVKNQYFFDGVIAEPQSWRAFWAEVAPYSLLELGRIGGRETLVPAVPYTNDGSITRTVNISALFNAGNILEDSYKEEYIDYGTNTQDLIATVIYRDTERDGVFPRNNSVEVRLSDVTDASGIRQTFDLSQYVTRREQAIDYAKVLCRQRRHVRKNIEFRTFPTDSPLEPGRYIYVDVGQQEWQNIYSGRINEDGTLNMPYGASVPDGTQSMFLYRLGSYERDATSPVQVKSVSFVNGVPTGTTLDQYKGWLFVLGSEVQRKRVFRVVEVQMDEEGEVTVRAVEHPCDADGSLISKFDGFTVG
jgi:hypothetical protein